MIVPDHSPTNSDEEGAAGDILWAEAVRGLPSPVRAKLLDHIVTQSRKISALSEELERLRPPPTPEEIKARRDQMIIRAIASYEGAVTVRAKALAKDLRTATGLKHAPSSERLIVAVEIVRLNCGDTLAWRQIYEIWRHR